ncbi:hypothetical protein G5I_02012 [Acromyrmex echinatior]|uniref:Uncharacterized protein n=1 Tax=Acromyrmex echinatior TaxID=103372 RepID=F4W965_ACREC|nr:hypothetical protein G5I_02012 [Acromyrmex echinatior]
MHDLIRVTLWLDVRPRISRASRCGAFQISLPAPFSSTDFNYLVQPSRLPDIAICDSEAARPSWGAGHVVENHIGTLALVSRLLASTALLFPTHTCPKDTGCLVDIFPRNCESNETLSKQKQSPRRLYDQNRRLAIFDLWGNDRVLLYTRPQMKMPSGFSERECGGIAGDKKKQRQHDGDCNNCDYDGKLVKGKRRGDRE